MSIIASFTAAVRKHLFPGEVYIIAVLAYITLC